MNKEFKVDYVQFSSDRNPRWLIDSMVDYKKRSNKNFYTHMTTYTNGAVKYEGNANSSKSLFVLSGNVCSKIGITPDWMKSLIDDGGKISRLDLCVTTDENILVKIQRDRKHIVSNMFNDMKIISDAEYTPQTIYIGDMSKRKRKGIVRAYDKGLQLGLADISMYRLEIELKQKHADISSKRYANGESIPSIMNGKFRIEREWYHDIFGNDESTMRFNDTTDEYIPEIVRKMAWLESQVMPSIQYVIDYDRANGTDNFKRLLDSLNW